jgi:hypothetical protein
MNYTVFERRHEKLASFSVFFKRMAASAGLSTVLVSMALSVGVAGYHWLAGFNWIDSFLEASMILGGMGPVNPLPTDGAKLFASCYALFSGLVFIAGMSILLVPVVHRMLHKFHLDESQDSN